MEAAIAALGSRLRFEIEHELRTERVAFAAKVRVARAILILSQEEFARRIGLTQRSVHRIEQGLVHPKRQTVMKIERFWLEQGIVFETLRDGGFRLIIESNVLR